MTNFKLWFKFALIRAVKTIAQTAVSLVGVGAVISDVDWGYVASAALLAGLLSLLTSVATGLPEVDETLRADENEAEIHRIAAERNELREAIEVDNTFENFDQGEEK